MGLPQPKIEVSALYYDYKFRQLPPHQQQGNGVIDLRFATLMDDLGLPLREAHDALNDAVMAALAFVKLRRDWRQKGERAGACDPGRQPVNASVSAPRRPTRRCRFPSAPAAPGRPRARCAACALRSRIENSQMPTKPIVIENSAGEVYGNSAEPFGLPSVASHTDGETTVRRHRGDQAEEAADHRAAGGAVLPQHRHEQHREVGRRRDGEGQRTP